MVGQKIRNPLCPFNFKRVVEVFCLLYFGYLPLFAQEAFIWLPGIL